MSQVVNNRPIHHTTTNFLVTHAHPVTLTLRPCTLLFPAARGTPVSQNRALSRAQVLCSWPDETRSSTLQHYITNPCNLDYFSCCSNSQRRFLRNGSSYFQRRCRCPRGRLTEKQKRREKKRRKKKELRLPPFAISILTSTEPSNENF